MLPGFSALENVENGLLYSGVPHAQRREKALAMLERVGLSERVKHLPNEMSGGEHQRVAIASALVNNPSFILADEPTGALDSNTGEEIMAIFRELVEIKGITVILVTHELHIAEFASRVITLKDGLIISDKKV